MGDGGRVTTQRWKSSAPDEIRNIFNSIPRRLLAGANRRCAAAARLNHGGPDRRLPLDHKPLNPHIKTAWIGRVLE